MTGTAMRGARRRAGRPLFPEAALLLAALLAAGCASRAGERAGEGAVEALRAPPPPGAPIASERLGRYATEGALAELTSPEGLASLATVVDASVTRSLEAALRAPHVQGRGGALPARSLVARMAHESAAAFGAAFTEELQRALGPDGRGPLARSMDATAARVSGSAAAGLRGELDDLFPGCAGEDRPACVEAGVRSLGRAAAAGFVEGVVASAAWPLAALAVLAGAVLTLVVQGAFGLLRRHRHPERGEAHS
jgi:hypothetical protein